MNHAAIQELSINQKHTLELKDVVYILLVNEGESAVIINGKTPIASGDGKEYPVIPGHVYTGELTLEFASNSGNNKLHITTIKSIVPKC